MTRNLAISWMLLMVLTPAAWSQAKPEVSDKPVITVAIPGADALFEDLELAFELAKDPKGFKTLKETIEVFLVGVEPQKPGGLRLYSSGGDLQYVLSLPVKGADSFKELLLNMWDLDLRTNPPPNKTQLGQVPRAIQAAGKKLNLAKDERMMFNIFDGFLRFESANGQVHIGQELPEVRNAKGGLPDNFLKGRDLAVHIDGSVQSPNDRRAAFAKAKKEVLGGVTKGEKETDAAFALRKALTEHQITEVERFFADSENIDIGWTTSAAEKNAKMAIDLSAVAGTSLEQSIAQLGQSPDEFAGVGAEGTVLKGMMNFPLDELRKGGLKAVSKPARDDLKEKIDADEKLTKEQKQVDKDLVDLIFNVVDDIGAAGTFNGFLRVWSNGNTSLTLCGGVRVPDGPGFVKILQTFVERGGGMKVELKTDMEGDVEIHKLSLGDLQKDYPELLDQNGQVYVGTAANAVWFAAGNNALDRLKQGIQQAKTAGPQATGPVGELKAQLYPLMEVFDAIRTRQKPAETPKTQEKKTAGKKGSDKKGAADKKSDADVRDRATGMLASLQLRKLALEAFKAGKDTISLSLKREDKSVKLDLELDEAIIRLVGKAASKFVKDNLADD